MHLKIVVFFQKLDSSCSYLSCLISHPLTLDSGAILDIIKIVMFYG